MTSDMELVVDAGGGVRCVYGEELDLRELGKLQITRASHVEPDADAPAVIASAATLSLAMRYSPSKSLRIIWRLAGSVKSTS
jgi:hypothetical protein